MSSQRVPEQSVCQIGILVPVIGLPMLAVSVIWSLVRGRPEARTWRRRLTALLVVDLVVAAAVVMVLRTFWGGAPRSTLSGPVATSPVGARRVIGIRIDPDARVAGARVAAVLPDSPADQAGLRTGDVVVAVDGAPVGEARRLPDLLQSPSQRPRTLRVERGRQILEKVVVPVEAALLPQKSYRPFEVDPDSRACTLDRVAPVTPVNWAPQLGAFVTLLILGMWRRVGQRGLWFGVALLPSAALGIGLACVLGLCLCFGGRSLGVGIVGMIIGEGLLLVGAALLLRSLRARDLIPAVLLEPRLSLSRTLGLGAGYMLGGGLRVALVIAGGGALMLQAGGDPWQLSLSAARMEPLALVLLTFLGVVLGPAAEEVYFRGVLLPWLAVLLDKRWALGISAVLFGGMHLHYGANTLLAVLYGFVLGWARMRSGGLWAPFILHAAMNLLAGWVLLTAG